MENKIKRRQLSPFGQFMAIGKPGDHYYSDKTPKDITSVAFASSRKVKTEKVLCIQDYKTDLPNTISLVKVTILE